MLSIPQIPQTPQTINVQSQISMPQINLPTQVKSPPVSVPQMNQTLAEIQALIQQAPAGHGVEVDKRQHVLLRPDTYIGSTVPKPRVGWLWNFQEKKMMKAQHSVPDGQERIFLEILWNAADNANNTHIENASLPPENRYPLGKIEVTMTETTITVKNNAKPIVIEPHYQHRDKYNPECIFGKINTSTNYDDRVERTGGGKNGIGAKATNVFSTEFSVYLGNPYQGISYKQTWKNNMAECSEPLIEQYQGEPFTQITYKTDFAQFRNEQNTNEFICLCARHAFDVSFTTKVPVYFNGVHMNGLRVNDYVKAYFGSDVKSIVYYEWPAGTRTVDKNGVKYAEDKTVVPKIELCIVDTPDSGEKFSFVNGVNTLMGGIHVEATVDAMAKHILPFVNEKLGANKNKKPGERKDPRKTLTRGDLEPNVTFVINCHLPNPNFDAQMKTKFNSFREPGTQKTVEKMAIKLTDELLKPMYKWTLMDRLNKALAAKLFMANRKTDGKKGADVDSDKYTPANKAGKAEWRECMLWLSEGDSAAALLLKLFGLIPGGKDFNGIFPLRGKMLNVMKAMESNPLQLSNNKEIGTIKKALGLVEGVDYMDETNFQTLNYGGIVIAADADVDGKHILGLVMNYFFCRFPSLLARGYVHYLRTPLLIASHGHQKEIFFTDGEYHQWLQQDPSRDKWTVKYFKGLGTTSDKALIEDAGKYRRVQSIYDQNCPNAFQLAFKSSESDRRKNWIATCSTPEYLKYRWEVEAMYPQQPISYFIEHELVTFSIANLVRAIPREIDGLKESERKIVFAMLDRWGLKKSKKSCKVNVFTGSITEKTHYHHGDTSLSGAIIAMAQGFVGTNNLPHLTEDGQFGCRDKGGALNKGASAPRYIETNQMFWVPKMYRKEDEPLLKYKYDDGDRIEPEFYLPIMPMHMINGSLGIATGFSTFIPCHNPRDIYLWLRAKILGKPLPNVLPWYRGFTGNMLLKEKKKPTSEATPIVTVGDAYLANDEDKKENKESFDEMIDGPNKEEDDDGDKLELEDDKFATAGSKYTLVTEGRYHVEHDPRKGYTITVTELPLFRWTDKYLAWLKSLKQKHICGTDDNNVTDKKSKKNRILQENPESTGNTLHGTINIKITGIHPEWIGNMKADKAEDKVIRALRLRKSFGMGNMVLLNMNESPIKHADGQAMLESFYNLRLPYYNQRKGLQLNKMLETIKQHEDRIRLIKAVLNGEIIVMRDKKGLPKNQVLPQLSQYGFTWDLYKTLKLFEFTNEKILELEEKINKLKATYQQLEQTPPGQLWLNDLNDFITVYCKHYKEPLPSDIEQSIMQEKPIVVSFDEPEDDD